MQKRCYECMEPMGNADACPKCGAVNKKEDSALLNSGRLLKERYFIGNIFSKSVDSTVYLAYDEELDKKVFVREYTGEEMAKLCDKYLRIEFRQKFLSYARATANITMCDVLPHTIDAFAENEGSYLVTDYFEGENLKTLLESGINISSASAVKIVQQLLKGLKHIHNSGIIFGSISPETLYVLKNGEVRLFGIASSFYDFLEDIDSKVEVLNPSYAAPEIFNETARVGAYTDVYSASAILYRLLTNKIPAISFLRSGGENLTPPKKANKSIPKNLQTALLNALNWQAINRTANPTKFLNELSAEKVKRKLSWFIIWANVLGFFQSVYDNFSAKQSKRKERKQKAEKKPKQKNKLLWLWITIPFVILALIIAILFIINPFKTSDASADLSSVLTAEGEQWYYGSGIETPGNSSKYVYGGYSSKKPASSKKPSSSAESSSSEKTESLVSSEEIVSSVLAESSSSAPVSSADVSSTPVSSVEESSSVSEVSSKEDPNIIDSPWLVGIPLKLAEKEIAEKGLLIGEIVYEVSTKYSPNYVINQTPASGKKIQKGSKINLVVSKGVEIPDVAGLSMSEAKEKLAEAGLKNIQYKFVKSDNAVGSVIEAYFESETEQTRSDRVIIDVSGEEIDPVSYYVGKTVAEVKAISPDINFVFVGEDSLEITSISDTDEGLYKVLAQDVLADSPAYRGITVTLTVARSQD